MSKIASTRKWRTSKVNCGEVTRDPLYGATETLNVLYGNTLETHENNIIELV